MHSFEIEQSRLQTQYDSFLVQMKGKMKSLIKDSPIYEYSEEILALMNRKKEEQVSLACFILCLSTLADKPKRVTRYYDDKN